MICIKYNPLSPHSCLHAPYATHAIVAEANSFTEKMISKKIVGQMDFYDEHFKYN